MPFTIRSFRRFSVCCPVTYHAGLCEGQGIVWNLSVNGCRISGDEPLRVGQTCPLTINLPNQPSLFVAAAIVRWVQGQEYGLETLVADKQTQSRLEQVIERLEQDSVESIE
jgi:PilZ domain